MGKHRKGGCAFALLAPVEDSTREHGHCLAAAVPLLFVVPLVMWRHRAELVAYLRTGDLGGAR